MDLQRTLFLCCRPSPLPTPLAPEQQAQLCWGCRRRPLPPAHWAGWRGLFSGVGGRVASSLASSSCSPKEISISPQPLSLAAFQRPQINGLRVKRGSLAGRHAGTVKILPSADPHGERGLGLECKNSTINLMFRAVAPTLVSGTF